MANQIEYKGYHASVIFSSEDEMLIGSVIGIRDSLNFHGSSIEDITKAFHDSIDGYLEMCERLGKSPDKEYKGTFNIRVSPELHREAALQAEYQGISLNQLVQQAIEEFIRPTIYKNVVTMLPQMRHEAVIEISENVYNSSRYCKEPILMDSLRRELS